mmetsp:Transcript_16361/g.24975  ORF Transcript_16361/g.24975 Transcript_16361/m.24975 type:complete len:282 (-) Transcript_16361:1916-2761(-)
MLYSINEVDATVALQNVKSFGTEGREQADPTVTFVPPQDAIHPYLVFRGSDIKDLHVHEQVQAASPASNTGSTDVLGSDKKSAKSKDEGPRQPTASSEMPKSQNSEKSGIEKERKSEGGKSRNSSRKQQRPRRNPQHQVGTGASLLNRKARGVVGSNSLPTPDDDFDFESNLANFEKEEDKDEEEPKSYEKDDFFDSISCDALDKQKGKDNRLRGVHERSLNTETFGAVALNGNRRYNRRGRGGGRGRGRGRGRGGRGRGRGRGRTNSEHMSNTNKVVEAS